MAIHRYVCRCAPYIPESGLWAEGLPPGSTFRTGPSPFRYFVAAAARGPSALPTFCCSCDYNKAQHHLPENDVILSGTSDVDVIANIAPTE